MKKTKGKWGTEVDICWGYCRGSVDRMPPPPNKQNDVPVWDAIYAKIWRRAISEAEFKKCHVDGTLSIRRRVFRRNATEVASASRPKQAFEVTVDSILSIMENDVHVLRTKMM